MKISSFAVLLWRAEYPDQILAWADFKMSMLSEATKSYIYKALMSHAGQGPPPKREMLNL